MHRNLDVECSWASFKTSLVWRLQLAAIQNGQNYQIMERKGLKGIIVFRVLASVPNVEANGTHLQSAQMAVSVLNALITQTKGDVRLFIPGQN